jgi:hypothetical protein
VLDGSEKNQIHDWEIAESFLEEHDFSKFIKYPYGGIEIKNTFGTKKPKTALQSGFVVECRARASGQRALC